ncbi:divalent-cation tolerance protein CutA [Phorcysia thermohydrogeniphila]|uniref:Divalent cation tolerance protein n=1 Tax=Phorcysia thermohydrogeniphila TaxID=936138 RepID=A0A4R1G8U4_9BACT|nr:divalent-cation tolerance protein CutA [Phorcysia thermohydrogeniphila]TCK04547.1 divalent cation tolerance protein [Phorcysia thermohydrogeniphila]
MEKYIQVVTTLPTKRDAERIGERLLDHLLVACVQIVGPIESMYWWRGKQEISQEWILIAKTKKKLYERVEEAIKNLHPYEIPEIIAVPIVAGYKPYLDWIESEVR